MPTRSPMQNPKFRTLSSDEREIVFRIYKGQCWAEILEDFDFTEPKVKTIYQHAIKKLQEAFIKNPMQSPNFRVLSFSEREVVFRKHKQQRLATIADEMNLSEDQIQGIYQQALAKLQETFVESFVAIGR